MIFRLLPLFFFLPFLLSAGEGEKILVKKPDLPAHLREGDILFVPFRFRNAAGSPEKAGIRFSSPGGNVFLSRAAAEQISFKPMEEKELSCMLTGRKAGTAELRLDLRQNRKNAAFVFPVKVLPRDSGRTVCERFRINGKNPVRSIPVRIPPDLHPDHPVTLTVTVAPDVDSVLLKKTEHCTLNGEDGLFHTAKTLSSAVQMMQKRAMLPARREAFRKLFREGCSLMISGQNEDGSFSWFPGKGLPPDPAATLAVAESLTDAVLAGEKISDPLLDRLLNYLKRYGEERKKLNPYTPAPEEPFAVHLLSRFGQRDGDWERRLFRHRKQLPPVSQIRLARSLPAGPEKNVLLRDAEKLLSADPVNGTLWFRIPDDLAGRWTGDQNRTCAEFLELLLDTAPADPRVRLAADTLAADFPGSDRAGQAVIRALSRYSRESPAENGEYRLRFFLDGKEAGSFERHAGGKGCTAVQIPSGLLKTGTHELTCRFSGSGSAGVTVMLRYEEKDPENSSFGYDLQIRRRLLRKEEDGGLFTEEILPGEPVGTGTETEIRNEILTKKEVRYLRVRIPLPAGFVFSGKQPKTDGCCLAEYSDSGALFFFDRLPAGKTLVSCRIRGRFAGNAAFPSSVCDSPSSAHLRGDSGEIRLEIDEVQR